MVEKLSCNNPNYSNAVSKCCTNKITEENINSSTLHILKFEFIDFASSNFDLDVKVKISKHIYTPNY